MIVKAVEVGRLLFIRLLSLWMDSFCKPLCWLHSCLTETDVLPSSHLVMNMRFLLSCCWKFRSMFSCWFVYFPPS